MKRDWLEQTSRNDSKFTIDGYEDCIKALPGDHQQHEGAVATFLSVDNKPVAIEIGFARKGHYYAYIGAFDWGWRDFSVGKIQMEETLSWAVDVGFSKYDLLAEPANYKDSWSNMQVDLSSFVQARTLKGKLLGPIWQNYLRPKLKTLFNNLPGNWRSAILGLIKRARPGS